jgi:chromosome segregation ATPase
LISKFQQEIESLTNTLSDKEKESQLIQQELSVKYNELSDASEKINGLQLHFEETKSTLLSLENQN